MVSDAHQIWRYIARSYEALQEIAPDGYETIVEVFVVGRAEPIRLNTVRTRSDLAWAVLVSERIDDGDIAHEKDLVTFVPDGHVERVEIRFQRAGGQRTIGFSHSLIDE